MQTLMRCEECGFEAFPAEWRLDTGGLPEAQPDKFPDGTKIRRERSVSGRVVWHIPASGKSGGFLFFGLVWVFFTALLTEGLLFRFGTKGPADQPWFSYLFFTLFWAVGIRMLYVAVRNKYTSHRITITQELVTLRREMFGLSREKSLATPTILSVAQVVFYQQNYQPVHGVEIRGPEGKLRFGTTLREDEKAWLVANLKRAVFGKIRA